MGMFGKNALAAYKGATDEQALMDLEAERKLKLQKMNQNLVHSGNVEQRRQVQQNQQNVIFDQQQEQHGKEQERQEDKNKAQMDVLTKQMNRQNVDALDTIMLDTFKTGDYGKVNRIFTDSTDNNVHKMIKTELETALGGTIVKIERNPDRDNDDVEDSTESKITIQLDNGTVQEELFDLDGFTQRVGTPARVGNDVYEKALMTSSTNVKTGAIDLQTLYKNALLGGRNGDAPSKKILTMMEDYMKLGKNGKATPRTIEDTQEAMLEAMENGDSKAFGVAKEQYEAMVEFAEQKQKMNTKLTTTKKLTPKQKLEMQEQQDVTDKKAIVNQITTTNLTDENIDKTMGYIADTILAGKPNENAIRIKTAQIYKSIMNKDEQDIMNPKSEDWMSGRATEQIARNMKINKQLEDASAKRTNIQQTAIDSMDAHSKVVDFTAKLKTGYKDIEAKLGKLNKNFGTNIGDRVSKSTGQVLAEFGNNKVNLDSLATEADKLYGVINNPSASTEEKKRATDTIKKKFRMGASTEGFLIMKDMLKLLSGAGVTNEELERYSREFIGTDFTDMQGIIQNLTSSSKASMKSFNMAYDNGKSAGLYATSDKKLMAVRRNSQNLREEWGDDIYSAGLSNLELTNPSLMSNEADKFFKNLGVPSTEKFIKDYTNNEYNYALNNGGSTKGFDPESNNKIFKHMDNDEKRLNIQALQEYKKAVGGNKTFTAPKPPKVETPTTGQVTRMPTQQELTDAGISYNKQDTQIIKHITGKEAPAGLAGYNAKNSTSTASGKYQFVEGTLNPLLKKLGKTRAEYDSDPIVQEQVFKVHYYDMKAVLHKVGRPVNKENMYTVHQLGAGRAKRLFDNKLNKDDLKAMYDNLHSADKERVASTSKAVIPLWIATHRGGKS